jgi:hypothetical protein
VEPSVGAHHRWQTRDVDTVLLRMINVMGRSRIVKHGPGLCETVLLSLREEWAMRRF